MLARDQFVDLYELLELPVNADTGTVRERINQLYLEAQRNIDHHNFRKRFYYQELFEVHLPQAHDFLLNPERRAQYDRYLNAFRTGKPFPVEPVAQPQPDAVIEDIPSLRDGSQAQAPPSAPSIPSSDMVEEMLPNQDSVNEVLPTYDEAQAPNATVEIDDDGPSREELWKKWKSGLEETTQAGGPEEPAIEGGTRSVPPTAKKTARTGGSGSALPRDPTRRTAASGAKPPARRAAAPSPAHQAAAHANSAGVFFPSRPWVGIPPDEVERRRDSKRRDLIKHELQTANTKWRLAGGTTTLALGGIVLYWIYQMLSATGKHTTGMTLALVVGAGVAVVVQLSLIAANTASREVRRRIIAQLSKMPYDELLKRCKV